MTKYYAAVDEEGYKTIHRSMPTRVNGSGYWAGSMLIIEDITGFPEGLTWKDEPVEVELIASDELQKLKAENESLWIELGKGLQEK